MGDSGNGHKACMHMTVRALGRLAGRQVRDNLGEHSRREDGTIWELKVK